VVGHTLRWLYHYFFDVAANVVLSTKFVFLIINDNDLGSLTSTEKNLRTKSNVPLNC
jgi:hypothetical protein